MRQIKFNSIAVGDIAPDFLLPSLDNRDVRLSDYSGRKLILFMWASW